MLSIFPLWTFHSYVVTFQQHRHKGYISLSWYDIPECVVPTRIALIEGCWGSSSGSTSDTRYVNLVTNPVISNDWGKDLEGLTKGETYPWSFVTQIYLSGQPNHGFLMGFVLFHLYCICMFCRSLFVLLDFFFWSLWRLFFFDIRILITFLVSSNSSYSCTLMTDETFSVRFPGLLIIWWFPLK
jgi:hypothetical protein